MVSVSIHVAIIDSKNSVFNLAVIDEDAMGDDRFIEIVVFNNLLCLVIFIKDRASYIMPINLIIFLIGYLLHTFQFSNIACLSKFFIIYKLTFDFFVVPQELFEIFVLAFQYLGEEALLVFTQLLGFVVDGRDESCKYSC